MRRSYFWHFFYAEFRKMSASRMPQIYWVSIFAALYLWVFSFYHVEHAQLQLAPKNFFAVLPFLFSSTWLGLPLHLAVLAFCAHWISIENQYGMIRVACTQPVSRVEYMLGKYAAISIHVILLVLVYLASLCAWLILYSGVRGFTAAEARTLGRLAVDALAFSLALSWICLSAASFRRTMGGALVTACMACVALSFLTTIPHDVIHPKYIFMRYFVFPLGDLPNPYQYSRRDNPFIQLYTHADFYRVMLLTPVPFVLAALAVFHRRDITE